MNTKISKGEGEAVNTSQIMMLRKHERKQKDLIIISDKLGVNAAAALMDTDCRYCY
jgi:hypothetical protein